MSSITCVPEIGGASAGSGRCGRRRMLARRIPWRLPAVGGFSAVQCSAVQCSAVQYGALPTEGLLHRPTMAGPHKGRRPRRPVPVGRDWCPGCRSVATGVPGAGRSRLVSRVPGHFQQWPSRLAASASVQRPGVKRLVATARCSCCIKAISNSDYLSAPEPKVTFRGGSQDYSAVLVDCTLWWCSRITFVAYPW
jgi:hypothetical protein